MADRYTGRHRERKKSWGRRSVVAFGSVVLGATLAACGPSGGGETTPTKSPTASSAETTPGEPSTTAVPSPTETLPTSAESPASIKESTAYKSLSPDEKAIIDRLYIIQDIEAYTKEPLSDRVLYTKVFLDTYRKFAVDKIKKRHPEEIGGPGAYVATSEIDGSSSAQELANRIMENNAIIWYSLTSNGLDVLAERALPAQKAVAGMFANPSSVPFAEDFIYKLPKKTTLDDAPGKIGGDGYHSAMAFSETKRISHDSISGNTVVEVAIKELSDPRPYIYIFELTPKGMVIKRIE